MNTTTTTSNTTPWAGQQPYLTYGFQQAQNNYQNQTPQYFPNQGWVDFSQPTLDGLGQTQGIANQNQVGFAGANEAFNTLSGQYLDSNPYINDIVDRTTADVGNSVNSAFASGGRYGSNAHADTLSQSVADASAGIRYQNYGDERENMMRGLALAPQSDALQYAGADRLMGVGSALENKQYEVLQDDVNRWNFDQNQPDTQLANYMGLIQGNYGGQTNSTAIAPEYGGSSGINALGGGMAGYSLGNSLSGGSGWGGALGALGGGLLGLFS